MEHNYSIYRCFGNINNETYFQLLSYQNNIDDSNNYINTLQEHLITSNIMPIHENMTSENNYTFIGNRTDCSQICNHCCFGGYVIEMKPTV